MGPLWKMVRKHLSVGQLLGFMLANAAGVSIFLLSVRFHADVAPLLKGNTSVTGEEHVIITKNVNPLKSLGTGRGNTFSREEIENIAAQDFADAVAGFRSADFSVYAELSISGIGMSTDMFLESVPDEFVDNPEADWNYVPGDASVPVVLPRNYLDLYNFAFAPAQNLPQISEELAKAVEIVLHVRGSRSETFRAHLSGFSNRINTILVPDSFLEYANRAFGSGHEPEPLRLILKTHSAGDAAFAEFMEKHNYRVSDGRDSTSRAAVFLGAAVGMVAAVGLLICFISMFLLVLGTYLVVEKNVYMHSVLFRLGYSPWQSAAPYVAVVSAANFAVAVLALIVVYLVRNFYIDRLGAFFADADLSGFAGLYPVAAIVCVGASALSSVLIYRRIAGIERSLA